jgi:hypothetical protein
MACVNACVADLVDYDTMYWGGYPKQNLMAVLITMGGLIGYMAPSIQYGVLIQLGVRSAEELMQNATESLSHEIAQTLVWMLCLSVVPSLISIFFIVSNPLTETVHAEMMVCVMRRKNAIAKFSSPLVTVTPTQPVPPGWIKKKERNQTETSVSIEKAPLIQGTESNTSNEGWNDPITQTPVVSHPHAQRVVAHVTMVNRVNIIDHFSESEQESIKNGDASSVFVHICVTGVISVLLCGGSLLITGLIGLDTYATGGLFYTFGVFINVFIVTYKRWQCFADACRYIENSNDLVHPLYKSPRSIANLAGQWFDTTLHTWKQASLCNRFGGGVFACKYCRGWFFTSYAAPSVTFFVDVFLFDHVCLFCVFSLSLSPSLPLSLSPPPISHSSCTRCC